MGTRESILHRVAVVVADALTELHEAAGQLVRVEPVPGGRHCAARRDRPAHVEPIPTLFKNDVLARADPWRRHQHDFDLIRRNDAALDSHKETIVHVAGVEVAVLIEGGVEPRLIEGEGAQVFLDAIDRREDHRTEVEIRAPQDAAAKLPAS